MFAYQKKKIPKMKFSKVQKNNQINLQGWWQGSTPKVRAKQPIDIF